LETFSFVIIKIFLQFSTNYLQTTFISLILKVTICKYYTMCKNYLINHTRSEGSERTSFTSPIKSKKRGNDHEGSGAKTSR